MKPEFIALAEIKEALPKPSLPEIAFVGRSNVGKSSLINTLLGQKIARTSSTPGRTQGLCFYRVKKNLIFVDFPGYGYAKTSKTLREQWSVLAEHYFQNRRTFRGTVWIYDLRRDPDALDQQMKEWLFHQQKPFYIALTKCDILGRGEWQKRLKLIAEGLGVSHKECILFSSKTKEGLKKLWNKIEK